MKIYKSDNTELIDVVVKDDSYYYNEIMGSEELSLMFSLTGKIDIPIGSYCSFLGLTFYLEDPGDITIQGDRNYEYSILFCRGKARLHKYKLRNLVDGRLFFPMTARPSEFLALIVANMNSRPVEGNVWVAGECITAEAKLVPFDYTFIDDALQGVADAFGTEWEIVGNTIHLRKVEYNKSTPLALAFGKGKGFKTGVKILNIGYKPVELLYIQGTDRNIDFSVYGNKTLLLPKSQSIKFDGVYFEGETGYDSLKARTYRTDAGGLYIFRDQTEKPFATYNEDSLDVTKIYPAREGTISSVEVVDEATNQYDIIDLSIPEALDYSLCRIAGETAIIIFQSGMLSGREFSIVSTADALTGYVHAERRFQLVAQEYDGIMMPNSTFTPAIGDKYAVFNIQLPEAYVSDNTTKTGASWDVFRESVKHFFSCEDMQFGFDGVLDGIWAKTHWTDALNVGGKCVIGGFTSFTHQEEDPVLVRIRGIKHFVNQPYKPVLELNNTTGGKLSSELRKIGEKNVLIEDAYKRNTDYTRRSFRDAMQSQKLLQDSLLNFSKGITPITVRTMQAIVGDDSLQFIFTDSTFVTEIGEDITFDKETKKINIPASYIRHETLGLEYVTNEYPVEKKMRWILDSYQSAALDVPAKIYYLYVKVSSTVIDGTDHGSIVLSETAIGMEEEAGFYHLLFALINSESDGDRSISVMSGYSEWSPGRFIIRKIQDKDANLVIDLVNRIIEAKNGGLIKGKMEFKLGSKGLHDLDEWPDLDARVIAASPYNIDLTNENASVACDSAGTVIGDLPASQANVYFGGTLDTGWAFSRVAVGCTGTIDEDTGAIAITGLTADTATFTVTATKTDKPTLVIVMNISKVKGGTNGEDAVIYSVSPEVSVIKIAKTGTITPSTISCAKMKQVGNSAPEVTTEKVLKYQVSGGTETTYSIGLTPLSSWVYIDFILYDTDGTTVLDKERVPVIIDGVDGASGSVVVLAPTKQVFSYSAAGTLTDSGTWFVWSTVFNLTGTLYYEWIVNGTTVQNDIYTGYGLVPPTNFADMPVTYKVNVRIGSTTAPIVATDMVTIYGVKPGANGDPGEPGEPGDNGNDAYTVVLSNETHALPASSAGVVSDYLNSGTDIMVWLGVNQVPYDTGNSTFDVTATPSNITTGAASTVSTYTRRFADHSVMTADNASITYTIKVRNAAGTEVTITRTQTFTKAKAGTNGTVGYEYLAAAIEDGSTEVLGGLILTNMMMLRNLAGSIISGMSGIEGDNTFLFADNSNAYAKALQDKAMFMLKKDGTANLGIFKIDRHTIGVYPMLFSSGGDFLGLDLTKEIMRFQDTAIPALSNFLTTVDTTVNYTGGNRTYSGAEVSNFGYSSQLVVSTVDNFNLTVTGYLETQITNDIEAPSMTNVSLKLYQIIGGQYNLIREIDGISLILNAVGQDSDSKTINTTFGLTAGTYVVRAEYTINTNATNEGYVSAHTIALHATGASANECMIFGTNGFVRIKNGTNYAYLTDTETAIAHGEGKSLKMSSTDDYFLKIIGVVNMPGVLGSATSSSSGTLSNVLGNVIGVSKDATGLYTITHNLGFSTYTAMITPVNASGKINAVITSRDVDDFSIRIADASNNTATDSDVDMLIIGNNV
ncbi:MAG: hypothetical protein WC833_08630 [Bacteroidales bacterium]|jgi:hypothetical protein